MSSLGALSLLPRHVVTGSTPASRSAIAAGAGRACARSSQRCIYSTCKYWTSAHSTSSPDTVLYQPFSLTTDPAVTRVQCDSNPSSTRGPPGNDLTQGLLSSESGGGSEVPDASAQRLNNFENISGRLLDKGGPQVVLAKRKKTAKQEEITMSDADTTEPLKALSYLLSRLGEIHFENLTKINLARRSLGRKKVNWHALLIEQRNEWLASSHDELVKIIERISAFSKLNDRSSSLSKEQDTSNEELLESSLARSNAIFPEGPNQAVAGHSGGSTLQNRARGRSCLVTGATSGIGYEVVKHLALEGATHIRIISRELARGEAALRKIKEETACFDLHTEVLRMDLIKATPRELATAFRLAPGEWPPIDTVVLCAGMSQSKLAMQTSPEDVEQIINTNLKSNIGLSGAFLASYFRTQRPRGARKEPSDVERPDLSNSNTKKSLCLVSVASLLAHKGGYGASVYAASKAGLIAYNRALTVEAGAIYKKKSEKWPEVPPFRINTVSPGYIDTPMTKGIEGEGRESLENQIPLGRFGKAAEVADAVMFLIGNEYANNCEINLDGGLSAT